MKFKHALRMILWMSSVIATSGNAAGSDGVSYQRLHALLGGTKCFESWSTEPKLRMFFKRESSWETILLESSCETRAKVIDTELTPRGIHQQLLGKIKLHVLKSNGKVGCPVVGSEIVLNAKKRGYDTTISTTKYFTNTDKQIILMYTHENDCQKDFSKDEL